MNHNIEDFCFNHVNFTCVCVVCDELAPTPARLHHPFSILRHPSWCLCDWSVLPAARAAQAYLIFAWRVSCSVFQSEAVGCYWTVWLFSLLASNLQSRPNCPSSSVFKGIYHHMCPCTKTHRSLGIPSTGWPGLKAVITRFSRFN